MIAAILGLWLAFWVIFFLVGVIFFSLSWLVWMIKTVFACLTGNYSLDNRSKE